MDDRSVTLYDISAAANLKTLLADRPQYALGRIVIPNIPVCDGAVYVSGDSMYPILKSATSPTSSTVKCISSPSNGAATNTWQ